ncbi:hypothetical protein [Methylotuvimicrobium buryatense]|uniref:Uncharacterized protein n=1 Tax=Methylotuvimicrobium buryatense TaxID=95641 RepID=A0A4P9UJA1_METBY|nr:hypothetical protein [Methylotuvimicrobium buryatense]QCW81194.1 hypothetical protein EQU24_02200 [Methylotuvimicrobium buryatense]
MKKPKKPAPNAQNNLVAKHAHQFNKAQIFRDKTQYRRKAKHQGREPLPIMSMDAIGKGFSIENTFLYSKIG